jgi:hypothetical protein
MSRFVPGASIADRLSDEVGADRVVAALFSTFTFRREFFERVPLPLFTLDGRKRGLLPVTVIVDRSQFEGNGWGYEAIRAPGDRLWHAKLVAVMTEQLGRRRTVLAIGSGNLTPSGWEHNMELFHLDAWWEWRLPEAVLEWLRSSWVRTSAFATWAKNVGVGAKARQYRSVLGSFGAPLWPQLDFARRAQRWSVMHVVSPFGDVDGEDIERASGCGPFFDHVVDCAASKTARMTVYLRAVDEVGNGAYGDAKLLARVSKRVNLKIRAVPVSNGRMLHAKLLAARTNGTWSIVLGSPNATGPAFVAPHGNVELACEFRNIEPALPRGLLPESRAIGLEQVVLPPAVDIKPRWECLESAVYEPSRRKIILRWKEGHGLFDSRVLLDGQDLDPKRVDLRLVADRFLETVPRRLVRRKYAPDFVPIDVPVDEPDVFNDALQEPMTPDDWLARLDAPACINDLSSDGKRAKRSTNSQTKSSKCQGFRWRDRVAVLDARLRGLHAAISEARTKREIDHLRQTVRGIWGAHDPREPGLTSEARAWRRWVRAGLWQVLNRCDRRIALLRPLSQLADGWKRALPASLRVFYIA